MIPAAKLLQSPPKLPESDWALIMVPPDPVGGSSYGAQTELAYWVRAKPPAEDALQRLRGLMEPADWDNVADAVVARSYDAGTNLPVPPWLGLSLIEVRLGTSWCPLWATVQALELHCAALRTAYRLGGEVGVRSLLVSLLQPVDIPTP